MIVDASVVLSAFFPDEAQPSAQRLIRDHLAKKTRLQAPDLLCYEVANAVWQAERRGRIIAQQAAEILQTIDSLEIDYQRVSWQECLPLARKFQRSIYDAAYLALAKRDNTKLITGDKGLYHSVRDELSWVVLLDRLEG